MKTKPIPTFTVKEGDCASVLSSAKPNYFGCVVTSPPYNVGRDYGNGFNDKKPFEEYLTSLENSFLSIYRVLRSDGLFFMNIGNSHSDAPKGNKAHAVSARAQKMGFKLVGTIVWVKSITITDKEGNTRSHGHFTPIKGKRLNSTHEFVFVFAKSDDYVFKRESLNVPYADKSNIGRYSDKDGRCIGDTWFIPYPTKGKTRKKGHPVEFPPELPRRCIKLTDGPVLDPFAGGGATGVAALKLGREVTLVEQNPEFCQSAKDRLDALRKKILKRRSEKVRKKRPNSSGQPTAGG